MASIRRRNSSWQVQVSTPTKRISATFSTLAEARMWALENDLSASKSATLHHTPDTFAEVLEEFAKSVLPMRPSRDVEKYIIASLIREGWPNKPLSTLDVSDLLRFRDIQLETRKPATVKRKLGLCTYACRLAREEWRWNVPLETFRAIRVRAPQQLLPRRIADGDVERLLGEAERCANPSIRHIIVLALETGMRRGELCSLTWAQVDFTRFLISLENTKSGYPRLVPMSPLARETLLKVRDIGDGELVFDVSANALRMSFCRLRERANLPRVRFHDLRHEAISRLFEKGLTPPEVALISGHRTMSMLMRYSHASIDAIGAKLQSDIGVTLG